MLTAVYHLQSQPQTPEQDIEKLTSGLADSPSDPMDSQADFTEPHPGLPDSQLSVTDSRPPESASVHELTRQNEHLRNKLREFTKKLDGYISGTATGKPTQVVTTTRCEAHEAQIASLNKRVDMLLRENAALKKDLAASAPERITTLDNELAATKKSNRELQATIKALQADLRNAREGLANLPSELKTLRDQEQVHAQTVERYREQLKSYQLRHDQDMRTMRQQQVQISDLEAKLRKSNPDQPAVLPPLTSPSKAPKKRQPNSSSPQPNAQPLPSPSQRLAAQGSARSGDTQPADKGPGARGLSANDKSTNRAERNEDVKHDDEENLDDLHLHDDDVNLLDDVPDE